MISFIHIKKIFTGVLMFTIFLPYSMYAQSSEFPTFDENGFLIEEEITEEEALKGDQELELLRNEPEINPRNAKKGEIVACSDYYMLGSLHIDLTQNYSTYNAGDPIVLTGSLKNTNAYPLIGVDIKARLVKDIPEANVLRSEIIILEDINIAQNLTIEAGEEYPISYSHLLPLNAPSGDYQMYFYAVEQDRYNLSGLSFTNDITGSQIAFTVNGAPSDHIYLDQTQITVGDQEHNVMGRMTQHTSGSAIPVSIPLYNPETTSKQMTVTYNLYSWDSSHSKNLITTQTEQVTVEPLSEKMLTYTLTQPSHPVYYLSIEASPTDKIKDSSVFRETTHAHIRFAIKDISSPRLVFSTVTTYPLMQGSESSIVTCFQGMHEGEEPYAKIETTLKDMNGKILAQSLYEGLVPSWGTAIKQTLSPRTDTFDFILSTTVYDDKGNLIDQVDKVYTECGDADVEFCPPEKTFPWTTLLLTLGGVLILLGFVFIRKKMITIERV